MKIRFLPHIAAILAALAVGASVAALDWVERRESISAKKALATEQLAVARTRFEARLQYCAEATANWCNQLLNTNFNHPDKLLTSYPVLANAPPEIEELALVNDGEVKTIYSGHDSPVVIDEHLLQRSDSQRSLQNAYSLRVPVMGGMADLKAGKKLICYIPIDTLKSGTEDTPPKILAIALLDCDELFRQTGLLGIAGDLKYVLVNPIAFRPQERTLIGEKSLLHQDPVISAVKVYDKVWQLAVLPRDGWKTSWRWIGWVWSVGGAIAFALGFLVWMALSYPTHLRWVIEQTTAALRDREERYILAARGANDGFWDWDIAQNEIFYSQRFQEFLGFKTDESELTESWVALLSPDDRSRILGALHLHLEKHLPFDLECRFRTRDGSYRWFALSGQALWDEHGHATRMAGSIRDITAQKAAQEELKKAHDELEERVRDRTQALYKTNQELRDALATVKKLSGLLPICSSCKKIRDDHGYWEQIESYITEHSDAQFSHGLCPDCVKKLYPEYVDSLKRTKL